MDDRDKTKEQLIAELVALRAEVSSLNQQQCECKLALQHLYATGTDSHLAAIVASSGNAIISESLDGKILSWNPAAERMFGYTAEEAIGQPISIMVPLERASEISELLQKVRQGESVYQYETIRRCKDGQLIDVSVTVSPIRDAAGMVIAASVIKQDITKQKAALREREAVEASLRQSEASLSAFMQAIPDLITRVKRDGTRIAIFSGISHTLKPYPVIATVEDIMPPELAQQRLHYIQQAIDTQTLQVYEYSINLNGQLQYEEARIVAANSDEAFVMVRDITDRKRIEKQLELQALIVNTMAEGICLVRAVDGIIVYANPKFEAIFGYDPGELQGKHISIVNYASDRHHADAVTQEIFQQIETHGEYSYEVHNVKKDGTPFWCRATTSQFEHPEHGIVYVAVQQDISDQKQIEQALRDSEQRFAAIFNAAFQFIGLLNPQGIILEANQTALDFGGLQRSDVVDRPFWEARWWTISTETQEQLKLSIAQAAQGTFVRYEVEVQGSGNTTAIIDFSLKPIFDETGQVVLLIPEGRDITEQQVALRERKRIEIDLQKSEERYRAIVEDQTELICRFLPDATILFINDAYCRYFGVKREEVIGKSYQPIIFEEDQEQVAQLVRSMCRDNPTVLIENRVVVNGQVRWTQWVNRMVVGEDDQTVEYQSVGRDITDRKQVEASLRESNRRWQSLLDNVELVVVGLDQQGNVEYVNPFFLKLTGYALEEAIGQSWFDHFLPSDLRPDVGIVFQEMMQQGNFHAHYQNSILTKSGEERMIAWSNTLLHGTDGYPIGTISIGEDTTVRYRLERMKSEFISIVSHELRTPLTSMQAALSLLHENIIDPASEDGQTIIHIAADGVDRLVRLVNDILDLERLESGKIRLEKKSCNAADLVRIAIDQMQEMANQAGVILNAASEPFELYVDYDRLLQVLTNLLSNAIKFSSSGDQIWLSTELILNKTKDDAALISETSVDSVLFKVADQGRGIPVDKLESIFEQFHQVDASDSREKGGTGLGLAICRSIVEQHGGQIWAESVLEKGSVFYFIVPVGKMHSYGYQTGVDY